MFFYFYFIFIFYIFYVNAKQWSHAFMIIYSRLLEGILAFYPHFKKKISNMFMFWNYSSYIFIVL